MKFLSLLLLLVALPISAQTEKTPFQPMDVFELEWASDPQISPNGQQVVYRRSGYDVMTDGTSGSLWILNTDGSQHQKLTTRDVNEGSAVWSPKGDRIAFVSSSDEGSEIYVYWVNTRVFARISQLEHSPSNLIWAPDGKSLTFSMFVPKASPVVTKMPKAPKGAKWADDARITDRLYHEADGRGYIPPGNTHLFMIPADGGSPRQLTSGDFDHRSSLSFSPDGNYIYFSSNRVEDAEYRFTNSEVYKVNVRTNEITALTDQDGPDHDVQASPDGKWLAYVSYPEKVQTYQVRHIYVMDTNGNNKKMLSGNLDRSASSLVWSKDSKGIYFNYDDKGNTKVAHIDLTGRVTKLADNMGGTSLGRPYGSGSFSIANDGSFVYTESTPEHPADLVVVSNKGKSTMKITDLNSDLLDYRELGKVEEVWYKSSVDGRDLQGWIVKPPKYDASKKYPLLVENHGGPISNYGDRFTAEIQLYAADGYLVFYPNPRGSTSYGEEFGNLLYHNYPGDDYQDVMDGVDYLIGKNLINPDNMYVTGGSAGGIMTAWIIGKNNRFNAAVVQKPVMNWISKTLTADNYFGYANSRYPGQPWENFETYWKFSPISLVGNIETPTMVMVGMNDLRTPPSEAKQLYHALKLRKIETLLVEIPSASHGIANRPSNLIKKVLHTLAWFNKYNPEKKETK
ncbi:S9 family peptidase [Aegicerativicinus sediminis]|uniref:S9 family peptidase n=1 Tax=Aegicerativicinus sediminis TaxID=2893202 RepID=UPI001E5EE824|nr:S9 family peptidase [Aegicerativicinus sediminis]